MSKETVSNKISAGMERWQNTIEDIMNLRSSNHHVFKDNYWAQNGFEELRRYVKQGTDFSKELAAILQERVEAENYFSKCLAKLGTKLSKACKDNVGSCAEVWKHVAQEMEKRAEIHRNYSTSLSEELVKPMKQVLDNQMKIRKKIEGGVEKTSRALADCRSAEARAKKQSHAVARENERLQDQARDLSRISRSSSVGHIPHSILNAARVDRVNTTSERDAAKLQVKKRKIEDAVKKTEVDYYNVCVQAERARLEWESSIMKGASLLESLEEERLAQMQVAANCYLRLSTAVPPHLADCVNALVVPVGAADARSDMLAVRQVRAASAGAGCGACEQLLPDFYCEHSRLAMNKDRRKQSLMKILQLVKQDLDRERKSKQGLEKLSNAMKQTPNFGADDSQQNVADKLYHMISMVTYLEAVRYKVTASLHELEQQPPPQHPLSPHIQVVRDKQGLQHTILNVPPSLQANYQMEVNKNLQPNYTALTKSIHGEEKERRQSVMSRASSKLRIEHLSFRRPAEKRREEEKESGDVPPPLPNTPAPQPPPSPPLTPPDWSERGAGDGLSNQRDSDSDSDEFSSQSSSGESAEAADLEPARAQVKCRALYAYQAKLEDELNLTPGDVIVILDKQEDGWWTGSLRGSHGLFPASYVEEITTRI